MTDRPQQNSNDTIVAKTRQRRGSLKRKLLVLLLVVSLLPLTVVSTVSYYSAKESLREVAIASLNASVEEKAAFIENWFRYRLIDLESQSNNLHNALLLEEIHKAYLDSGKLLGEFIKSYEWHIIVDEKAGDLKTFCKLYEYHDVFLLDTQGNILLTIAGENDLGTNLFNGPLANTRFATTCQNALDTGQPSFSDLESYEPSNNVVAGFFAQAIIDEVGDKVGVFAYQITQEQIEYIMKAGTRKDTIEHRYTIGLASDGSVVTLRSALALADSNRSTRQTQDAQSGGSLDYLSQRIDTEQSRLWLKEHVSSDEHDELLDKTAFIYTDPKGKRVLGIHSSLHLANVDWAVIAEIPEAIAFAPVQRLRNLAIALLLATGLLVLIIALFTAHQIVKPIVRLSLTARLISQGDLNQEIVSQGNDELGDLARSFNQMVVNLSKLFAELSSQKYALDQHAIVSITDIKGNITYANDNFCAISGFSREELLGQNHRMVKSKEHNHKFYRDLWKTIATGQVWKGEIKNRTKDGSYYWVDATIVPFKDDQGIITQYIALRSDITQRKENETEVREINDSMISALHREKTTSAELEQTLEQLEVIATTDKLTGLPNRGVFLDRLGQELKQSARNDSKFAVLFFDFDRFKVVNDSLGHEVGDDLLCDIADIFRENLRDTDTASRIGGDEFVVLLTNLAQWSDAKIKGNELLELFAKPHILKGHRVVSTASIGLVTNNRSYEQASAMIRDADAAMYQAKETGKGRVVVFDQVMHEKAIDRLVLEEDLRSACLVIRESAKANVNLSTKEDDLYRSTSGEQFRLFYQPIVCLETGKLSGFEALIRWTHPTRGEISPVEFVPIAEETGLIVDIGKWVLYTAVRQIIDWNQRLDLDHRLSVNINLSKYELLNYSIVSEILECQRKFNLHSGDLKLEITESAIGDERSDIIPVLFELRKHGFKIAIDDFGTGLSSLSALHAYPIDILKIDQSFIRVLDNDRSLLTVVAAITTLADNLGITTVAEGIESAAIIGALQSIGCRWGQGYHFARPLSPSDAETYLLEHIEQKGSQAA